MYRHEDLMTIDETVEYLHGLYNRNALAQMRFKNEGPRYSKPSERKVFYRRSDVDAWLDASEKKVAA